MATKRGYWNRDTCQMEALKHNNPTAFSNGSKGAYLAAMRGGFLKDICGHMTFKKARNNTYTRDVIADMVADCTTKQELIAKNKSAYNAAVKNGWWPELSKHLLRGSKYQSRTLYERALEIIALEGKPDPDHPGCIVLDRATDSNGYPHFGFDYGIYNFATVLAETSGLNGVKVASHTCDNKACVNQEHITRETQSENLQRAGWRS